MRVMVTGGLGFLGRSLTERLLRAREDVTVVDDFSSSVVGPEHFDGFRRFRFVAADIARWSPGGEPYDRIIHCAGPVGAVGILQVGRVAKRIVDQVEAVVDIAETCRAELLFVSSSEVYGKSGSFAEDAECTVPAASTVRLEYGLGKRLAEAVVQNRLRQAGLRHAIVRPFNIAGPHQSAAGGFVLPTFVAQALAGEALTVFGAGTQVRAFAHVEDVVDGVLRAADRAGRDAVLNLGNPRNTTTILDLARRVVTRCGSSSEIAHVDPTQLHGAAYAEAPDKLPDIDAAMRLLAWVPKRSLDEIIDEVIAFQQHRRPRASCAEDGE